MPAFGLPWGLTGAVLPAPTSLAWLACLPIISIAALLLLVQDLSPRQAVVTAYCWGLGFFLAGVSWVYVSLAQFSGLPSPVAALATLIFCAFLALYPALAAAAYAWFQARLVAGRTGTSELSIGLFAALWMLAEWLRGTLFTGFPWLSLGYAQMPPSPLAGYASVVGVYGVGFASVLLAGVSLMALQARTGVARLKALALIVALLGAGAVLRAMDWTTPSGMPVPVRLLQGNVPQDVKWKPEHLTRSVNTYLALLNGLAQDDEQQQQQQEKGQDRGQDAVAASTLSGKVLHVLPETAIPLLFDQIPQDLLQALNRRGPTLLGAAVRTQDGGYLNAAVALEQGAAKSAGLYAKQHLVPFGEFSPPGFGWFFRLLRIPMADFSTGPPQQAPLLIAGARIAPNICYEDLFGEELLPALRGEQGATLLINVSNTAWFGDSLAQPQHLQIGRLRALETGRVMLRATNSGMTALIHPDGTLGAVLPPFTSGVLRVDAQPFTGLTPYAKWGNALILSIALIIVVRRWRKRP